MEASQHSLLAACFTLHSVNATLAIVPQRGAGLWITIYLLVHVCLLESDLYCPECPMHLALSAETSVAIYKFLYVELLRHRGNYKGHNYFFC
jgi:hypothetical protein